MHFETVIDNIKSFDIPHLFQVDNIVKNLIKSKKLDFKIDGYKRPNCPYCNSSIIKKNGKTSNGTQRYICLNTKCGKSFSSNTNSFLYNSNKLKDYLYPMIEYTLDGLSIRKISDKINVSVKTVWLWRTKILKLLDLLIDKENPLSNIFYCDETFIKINLKGTKPKNMPRSSYKTQMPSVCKRELVSIYTVVDDTKRVLFKIDGTSKATEPKVSNFLKPLITKGSTLVSDGDYSYASFTFNNDLLHESIIPPKRFSKNGYNLSLINSTHSSFKFFLRKYRGVSLKRLNGYINLFIVNLTLSKILNEYEKVSYIYESLLDLQYNLTNNEIINTSFPFDVRKLYLELMKEKLIC